MPEDRNAAAATTLHDARCRIAFRDVEHLEDVMTTPSPALVAEFASVSRRSDHSRRRRQDRPDAGATGQARRAGEACRRRRALQRDGACARGSTALGRRVHRGRSARSGAGRGAAEARRTWSSWPAASSARPGNEDLTWAMNAHVPALVAEAFAGSRIVAYSTGCVYPYVDVHRGRRDRGDADRAAARHLCQLLRRARGDVPVFLAHARHAGAHHPPQLRDRHALRRAARHRDRGFTAGADAQSHDGTRQRDLAGRCQRMVLRALDHCTVPTSPLNVSGPEPISVRWLAEQFGQRFGKAPVFTGTEAPRRRGWSTPPRRCGCSASRACRSRA